MKRIALILIGFLPLLLLGYLLNHLMTTVFYNYLPPYLLFAIGIVVLAVWFLIGLFSKRFFSSKIEPVILLNSTAFLILLLTLFQEIVLRAYWSNQIGLATQFFYLPLLNLSYSLLSVFIRHIGFGIGQIFAFVCLLGTSYLGCVIAERRRD